MMKRCREEKGNCLMLLTKVGESHETNIPSKDDGAAAFKCKTCNRKFSSFQALGGHRASHKKHKLMVKDLSSYSTTMKPRMHPCPICGVEFAVGQALGGHMRKHRVSICHARHLLIRNQHQHAFPILKKKNSSSKDHANERLNLCLLDLNLTPSENHLMLNLRSTAPVFN